ncbi:pyridoxamine 5'-phosphate oxidase [Thozetella sp. PMI_491]|nr:pyridoxamine 5'-phosphate oxidase [Thozetella sp. PMI_491]
MQNSDHSMKAMLRALPSLKGPFPLVEMDALPDTPHQAFRQWLDDAITENVKEPHAMTVSTVDDLGYPDARVVILKNVDERGWHFAITAASAKGQQIAGNSHVALSFYWPQLGRQIRLRGKAVELPDAECAQDFQARPIGSKTAAVASKQSQVLQNPDELTESLAKAREFLEANPDYVKPEWRVLAVDPDAAEFWQGSTDRLHKRLQYIRSEDGKWEKLRLWP